MPFRPDSGSLKKSLKEGKKSAKNPKSIEDILEKALEAKGLEPFESAALIHAPASLNLPIFSAAKRVKEKIYGRRIVLFAPLYISNSCINNCLYCGFRSGNPSLRRILLTKEEVAKEAEAILSEGHKRILLVASEDPRLNGKALAEYIRAAYEARSGKSNIRRINVNAAPMPTEDFKELKSAGIGTYQCFQETYDENIYASAHPSGPKRDFRNRIDAMERAFSAGIDDLGFGALFGLADWRFDALALLSHGFYFDKEYGVGPHTLSVPRIEPAENAPLSLRPPHSLPDQDFKRLIAVFRLSMPYTGMILSTRESAEMRNECFHLGISQISSHSRTNPGGYSGSQLPVSSSQHPAAGSQFEVSDSRTTDEVVASLLKDGFLPSFCTSCYRSGRTGDAFMALAKKGLIQDFCQPNAILTFQEYVSDYGSARVKNLWKERIKEELGRIKNTKRRAHAREKLEVIKNGKRDLFF
ncbi:MAG: [FeFe] hydrogenase H-cluster radical SAM maturase HydG [Candidatus Micrarchaeota archaeon]